MVSVIRYLRIAMRPIPTRGGTFRFSALLMIASLLVLLPLFVLSTQPDSSGAGHLTAPASFVNGSIPANVSQPLVTEDMAQHESIVVGEPVQWHQQVTVIHTDPRPVHNVTFGVTVPDTAWNVLIEQAGEEQ